MKRGFTLSELLLAAAILVFALTGLLLFFVNSIILNETNRNFTIAYSAIQAKMEEIKNRGFDNLFVSCPSPRPSGCFCNGDSFDLEGISGGNGRIEIIEQTTDLKRIRIAACFMSRNRLIGNNINDCQSSPVELVTLIVE